MMTTWTSEGPGDTLGPMKPPSCPVSLPCGIRAGSVPTTWGPEEAELSHMKKDGWVAVRTGRHPFL